MKKLSGAPRLVGVGVLLILPGALLQKLISAAPNILPYFPLVSILLLLAWEWVSYRLADPSESLLRQALLLCAFGLVMLALILYQELIRGAYWQNWLGIGSQWFFLPWISLAATAVSPFVKILNVWLVDIVCWMALFLASCLGCLIKRRWSGLA